MAREMYLAGVSKEELEKKDAAIVPRTPREKWENFWYHHKWKVLVGAIAAFCVVVFLAQILTRNDPDYTILVVTEKEHHSIQLEPIGSLLERYGEDIDGDGEVEVRIASCHLGDNVLADQEMLNYQILQSHLISADVMLFVFEPEYYEWFMSEMEDNSYHFLTDLEVEGSGITENGCVWNWKDDPRVTGDAALSALPQELYFAVRVPTGTAAQRAEEQQACLRMVQALVQDKPTATE